MIQCVLNLEAATLCWGFGINGSAVRGSGRGKERFVTGSCRLKSLIADVQA